jgi:hypothetical protein
MVSRFNKIFDSQDGLPADVVKGMMQSIETAHDSLLPKYKDLYDYHKLEAKALGIDDFNPYVIKPIEKSNILLNPTPVKKQVNNPALKPIAPDARNSVMQKIRGN